MFWQTARFRIDLSRPRVMGIVNVTPDSFFDGGRHLATDAARAHCDRLVQEGADILDLGGESTRPGAQAPSEQEEIDRVLPVLEHASTLGVPVSVDTSSPALMRAALAANADIVNDVRALRRPGALEVVVEGGELRTFVFAAGLALLASLLVGWLPARSATGVAPGRALLGASTIRGRARSLRRAMIGFEVALVRDQIALVGEPFTLVRSNLAQVGSAIAFVCFLVA